MYSPKEVCDKLGISYETLRFYCKEGLIPNIHRDRNNWRVFDDRNVKWIEGLLCLRRCDMSLKDMKQYMNLCLKGKESIPERKEMLAKTREELLAKQKELQGLSFMAFGQKKELKAKIENAGSGAKKSAASSASSRAIDAILS